MRCLLLFSRHKVLTLSLLLSLSTPLSLPHPKMNRSTSIKIMDRPEDLVIFPDSINALEEHSEFSTTAGSPFWTWQYDHAFELELELEAMEMEVFGPLMHENSDGVPLLHTHELFQDDICEMLFECDGAKSEAVGAGESDGDQTEKGSEIRSATVSSNRSFDTKEKVMAITFEELSRYFYLPITQAAKELSVGLTLLKKKCRELGIPRWPHRKMKSLQALINNVQELGREGGGGADPQVQIAIEILEEERRMMEKKPSMQLEEKTKRLRQACFKANYKRRRLMALTGAHGPSEALHIK